LSSKDAIHGIRAVDIQFEFVSGRNMTGGYDFVVFSCPGVCTSPSDWLADHLRACSHAASAYM